MGGFNQFRFILLISVIFFLFSIFPVTSEKYVSVDAVSGEGVGSFESPWSLSDSLNKSLPVGEQILVNGSSSTAYTGPFNINNETMLIGYNGTPVINSSGYAFIVSNSTFLDNFEVKSQSVGFLFSSGVSNIQLSNISLHGISGSGISGGSGNHNYNVSIHDISCYQNTNGGIVLPSVENLTIDNISVFSNIGGGVSLTGADKFTLIDVTTRVNSISSTNRPGLLLKDSSFGVIYNLISTGNSGGGLNFNNTSNLVIFSSVVQNQSGGKDLFIDSQSHNLSFYNLHIGGNGGVNLSASNMSGPFSFNTSSTPKSPADSFVSLNNYINITRGDSGSFDSLVLNYNSSDIPIGYPEENIRIMATDNSDWGIVPSSLNKEQHSIAFNGSTGIWEGTRLYGLFVNKTIPSIFSISPSSGSQRDSNATISILGSGFSSGLLVNLSNSTFNLTNSTEVTFINSSYITAPFDLTYLVSDNYSVQVKNPDQTQSMESVKFSVYDELCPSVVANFSSNVSIGYAPLTVSFTNSSTGGNVTSLVWDFGDNSTGASIADPVHTFNISGLYSVNLIAGNSCGNYSSVVHTISVESEPCPSVVANFSSNVSIGYAPLTVSFRISSIGGNVTSLSWEFGDGSSNSSVSTPVHSFNNTGTYQVNLTVWNSCGNSSTVTHSITVNSVSLYNIFSSTGPGGNITPTGNVSLSSGNNQTFAINPRIGYKISDVVVDDESKGAISTYLFSNVTSNHRICASFILTIGNYTINATASSGGTISPSGSVVVPKGGDQRFAITPAEGYTLSDVLVDGASEGAISSYTFTNVTTNHGIYTNFTRIPGKFRINSSANQWGKIVPIGNNLYPENSNQSFIMQAKPGTTLTNVTVDTQEKGPVRNWTFTNLTADHSIYVESSPSPGQIFVYFNATPRYGAMPLDVTFSDQCLGSPTSFYWQFGDGTTSTKRNPTHQYSTSGAYSVTLRASSDRSGGVGTWSKFVIVTSGVMPEPTPTLVPGEIIASFGISPMSGTAPLSVKFTDTSTGNPTSWIWDFGDGYTANEQNPVHRYTSTGSYPVTLLAQNTNYSGTLTIPNTVTVT